MTKKEHPKLKTNKVSHAIELKLRIKKGATIGSVEVPVPANAIEHGIDLEIEPEYKVKHIVERDDPGIQIELWEPATKDIEITVHFGFNKLSIWFRAVTCSIFVSMAIAFGAFLAYFNVIGLAMWLGIFAWSLVVFMLAFSTWKVYPAITFLNSTRKLKIVELYRTEIFDTLVAEL